MSGIFLSFSWKLFYFKGFNDLQELCSNIIYFMDQLKVMVHVAMIYSNHASVISDMGCLHACLYMGEHRLLITFKNYLCQLAYVKHLLMILLSSVDYPNTQCLVPIRIVEQ